jgi:hypothetical protein
MFDKLKVTTQGNSTQDIYIVEALGLIKIEKARGIIQK